MRLIILMPYSVEHPIGALLALGPKAYAAIGNGALARIVRRHGRDPLNAAYLSKEDTLTTPLSHAIDLLVAAHARAHSLFWPHVAVCRLIELGAHRLAPAHEGLGPPWCALLALLSAHGLRRLRSAHLLMLLEAVQRGPSAPPPGERFAAIWRERILPELFGELPAQRQLVHRLLHDLLPLRSASERALLETLLTDAWRGHHVCDPWMTYTHWGALGTLPPNASTVAHQWIHKAQPHCARRTRIVHRLLVGLPADVRAHIVRLHNRSLMLPRLLHEGWDLRLRLIDDD